jgi:hypothetical protein
MSSVGYPGLFLLATVGVIIAVVAYFLIKITTRKR